MGTFFVYIIKSAICLIIFYMFYKLLLSKDTFHRFNRIALLSLLLLSFVVPLGKISLSPSSEVDQAMVVLKDFVMQAEPATIAQTAGFEAATETSHLWVLVLIYTYLAGMVFFLIRQMLSLFMMFRLMKRSRKEKMEHDVTILVHWEKISPFSWMNYIFISEKDLEENGKGILTHELAHIHKKHSWDLIVADICIFFQWFNPAAWLLKQELQSIHEFEADDVVLNQGIDAKQYQLLLIKKAVGTRLYTMANSFNHSSLKKRITMMLREKSNPWARLKYLYVLPLACITMLAFARPDVSRVEKISAEKVNDLIALPQPENTTPEIQSADKINDISGNNNPGEVKKTEDQLLPEYGDLLAVNDQVPPIKENKKVAEDECYEKVDQMPMYPGGVEAMLKYLNDKLNYPAEALEKGISGAVIVGFVIDKQGKLVNAHIVRGLNEYLDNEALRVINTMPDWIPGVLNGKKVNVKYNLPVVFRVMKDEKGGPRGLAYAGSEPKSPSMKYTIKFTVPEKSPFHVSGKVISKIDNQPLSSVTVVEVGPSGRAIGATITKDDGTFELQVKNSDNKLKFSHVGYLTTESPVKETNNIQMDEKTLALEETVVVGYGGSTDKKEDIKSNQEQKYVFVEQMPQFPGDRDAFLQYILRTVRYPNSAKAKKIEGNVVCSCVINAEGRVTDVRVISSVDPDLDKEAKRVVENMPDWIPGKQNGKNTPVKVTIPINFKIAK